jgi:hypothetical protein
VPYVLPDGTIFAADWSSLVAARISTGIAETPAGTAPTYGAVWSYSTIEGNPYGPDGPAYNCNEWTSSSSAYVGYTQEVPTADGWEAYPRDGCQPVALQGLACFQQ